LLKIIGKISKLGRKANKPSTKFAARGIPVFKEELAKVCRITRTATGLPVPAARLAKLCMGAPLERRGGRGRPFLGPRGVYTNDTSTLSSIVPLGVPLCQE